MTKKVGRYIFLLVALALASVTFVGRSAKAAPGGAAFYADEDQPHMEAAMQHLRQAQEELQRATSDKGGHRVRAVEFIKQAQSEINAGMHFDDRH
jgi:hypothetical protein